MSHTIRASVDSPGYEGNSYSQHATLNADGRYLAFHSSATNLVAGDTNGTVDIFVRDMEARTTVRVSVDSSGNESNGNSYNPGITPDGRYVVFSSNASNLVTSDTNGRYDVFVHDRLTGVTERVSVDSSGNEGDHESGSYSWRPAMSDDGRFVAFHSWSSLVPDDTNPHMDAYVHDRQTGTTERVSVDSSGNQANDSCSNPAISADGLYVAFVSPASDLVSGDTNFTEDVFVHNRQTGTTERVSLDSSGNQGWNSSSWSSISGDGRYVAFQTRNTMVPEDTNNYTDVYVHDRQNVAAIQRVSVNSAGGQATGECYWSRISTDGTVVVFYSSAEDLVANDTNGCGDIFRHNRLGGTTERVSVGSSGNQADDVSQDPSVSSNGRFVAFHSYATNLVGGDANGYGDVFVHGQFDPRPDIKANGSDGPVTISQSDTLLVTAELFAGKDTGLSSDWWVLVRTASPAPRGWFSYHVGSQSWRPGREVSYQAPCADLSPTEIMNMTGLQIGEYTFYFGVDMIMNGSIDPGQLYYNSVEVTVTP